MGLGLDMLDVAIGVVFVYLLLSLIATAAAEAWAGFTKKRAKGLEQGIIELLRDRDLVQKIYNHPLINGLYKGVYSSKLPKKLLPSYIPARSFALAIMDLLLSTAQHDGVSGATTPQGAAVDLIGKAKDALQSAMLASPPQSPPAAPYDPTANQAVHAVVTLVQAAAGDAEKARANIEDWYNTAMDRVSGWYKKKTQYFLFAFGLIIAVALNVDSIRIVRELSLNKPRRDAIVGVATNYVRNNPAPATTTTPAVPPATTGSTTGGNPATTTTANTTTSPISESLSQANKEIAQLNDLGLPIGWKQYGCPCAACGTNTKLCNKITSTDWIFCWLLVIVGWLMTALAVSLGAPFWFDTLNKIIVIRSTVKPKEKSGTEAGKDPQQQTK